MLILMLAGADSIRGCGAGDEGGAGVWDGGDSWVGCGGWDCCAATGAEGWGRTVRRTCVRSSSAWLPLLTPRACLLLPTLGEKTFRTATKL